MNKKGVTLLILSIIIIVLVIISSTTIYFGIGALHKTSNFRIYSNLSLVYSKIEEKSEELKFKYGDFSETTPFPGEKLTDAMKSEANMNLINENLPPEKHLDLTTPFWRYLNETALANMKIPKKIKEEGENIFVNYETLEVIYTKGYKLPDGTYLYNYSAMKEYEEY